jgi:signal transduction histidine kinase
MVPLESSKLFVGLSPAEFKALEIHTEGRHVAAGHELFHEGDRGDGMYILRSGLVQIVAVLGQEERRVFSRIEPGEFFGEMAILEDKPRSATALVVKDSALYFIPRAEMLSLLERAPRLWHVLLQDISRRLRELNRQHVSELLQAERLALVGRFARMIIHDLKNPLNIISLSAEMSLADHCTPEIRSTGRARILKQVQRITQLIMEIMEFTQGNDSTTAMVGSARYDEFVQLQVEELRSEMDVRNVRLILENEPPPVRLIFNPQRLARVFVNLVGNAADVMRAGGDVRLRFHVTGKEVITELQDGGPGIAPEVMDRLFEAFATYGKEHGTGLGLCICKKIIEDHRGWITARNEAAGGAVFSFALPIHQTA